MQILINWGIYFAPVRQHKMSQLFTNKRVAARALWIGIFDKNNDANTCEVSVYIVFAPMQQEQSRYPSKGNYPVDYNSGTAPQTHRR